MFRLIFKPPIVKNHGIKIDTKHHRLIRYTTSIYKNAWESDEIRILKRVLTRDDRVLELGACTGFLSIYCSKKLGNYRVVAVEANTNLMKLIRFHQKLNEVKFKVINAVVGNNKSYKLNILPDIFASSLEKADQKTGAIEIRGISLNRIYKEFRFNFMIIDIEGGEYDLFLESVVPDTVNKILVEFHGISKHSGQLDNKYNDVQALLKSKGFICKYNQGRVQYFSR